MKITDRHEAIMKELVRNTRATDTFISQKTGIPLKTVNRLRRQLERDNRLMYFTHANPPKGDRAMIIVTFRDGITRGLFMEKFREFHSSRTNKLKHIQITLLGEADMKLKLILVLEGTDDPLEFFNSEIVPEIHEEYGHDAIASIQHINIKIHLKLFKNYLIGFNYDQGKINPDWPNDKIFI